MKQTIQFVLLKKPSKEANTEARRGDYPPIMIPAKTAEEAARALMRAWTINRVADIFAVVYEDMEVSIASKEFSARISHLLPQATKAGMTIKNWLTIFAQPNPLYAPKPL
jgi:hypothetical protein